MHKDNWMVNSQFKEIKRLKDFVKEVKNLNKNGQEKRILSLSYGKIKYRDLSGNFGLLPDNFNGYNKIVPGDIVLRLTDLQNDKKSLRVALNDKFGAITSAYTTIKTLNKDSRYISYFLKTYDFLKIIYNLGGGVRQSSNYQEIKNIRCLNVPSTYQTAISNYLDHHTAKIDDEVDYLEKKATLLEEFKQSLIFETVTKGLDKSVPMKDSGIEWLGEIPEHWDIKRVKKFISTLGKSKIASNDADDGVFDLYVSGKKIKKHSQSNLKEFAILLPTGGKFMANLPKNIPCAYSTDVLALKTKKMQLSFLYYYLNCDVNYFDHLFFKGAGLKHLQRNLLLDYMIPTPNLSEQKQIADYLDKECGIIDTKVNYYRKKAKLLKEYKQSLIYEAVTGKIEIPKEFF